MTALFALVLAFALTLVVSVPNDWARRRANTPVTSVTTVVNVVGIAVVVLICIKATLVSDAISVIAMVLGIAIAGVSGNAFATRVWGRAGGPL